MKITKTNVSAVSISILNICNKLTNTNFIGKENELTVIRSFLSGEPFYQVYLSGKLVISFNSSSIQDKEPDAQVEYIVDRLLTSYTKVVECKIEDIVDQTARRMILEDKDQIGHLELTTLTDDDSGIKVYRMFRRNTEIVTLSDAGRSTSGWTQFLLKLKEEVLEEVLEGRFELPE